MIFLHAASRFSRNGSRAPEPFFTFDRACSYAVKYSRLVGTESYKPEVFVRDSAPDQSTLVLRKHGESALWDESGDRWCMVAGLAKPSQFLNSMVRRAGRLAYAEPVWGSYAVVYGEHHARRITAWNTVPSTENIAYGQSNSHVFISNRPLLVALAMANGVEGLVDLSVEFLEEYLDYGYSVTGQMPYSGVRSLSPNEALVVADGEARIDEVPPGLESGLNRSSTIDEKSEALTESLCNARDRITSAMSGRPIQLRLSAGKDSRIILGLMRGTQMEMYGRVFGGPEDTDVRLAEYLGGLAGVPVESTWAPLATGSTIRQRVVRVLKQSDGTPLSEAHASIYAGANPRSADEGIMLGQWPLMKGGAATRMRYSEDQVRAKIASQSAGVLQPTSSARLSEYFTEWFRDVKTESNIEKLYMFSRDFRSARWMQALLMMYSRESTIVYPISDAEVASVSDALSMADKISESIYFMALRNIWPAAVEVPFGTSRWPFEARGGVEGLSAASHRTRATDVEQWLGPVTDQRSRPADYISSHSGQLGSVLARELMSSPYYDYIEAFMSTELRRVVWAWSNNNREVYRNRTHRQTLSLVWRLYVAEVWLSKEWID